MRVKLAGAGAATGIKGLAGDADAYYALVDRNDVYGGAQQPETNDGKSCFPVERMQAYRASAIDEASGAFCRHIAQMRERALDDLHLA